MTPSSPIRDFQLPVFAADGGRLWELRAAEGTMVSRDQVELRAVHLELFAAAGASAAADPAPTRTRSLLLESASATVRPSQRRAEGGGGLTAVGTSFTLTGESWVFEGRSPPQRLLVRGRARVTFNERIDYLLR